MQHPPLETIAKRLSVLFCEQEDLCRPIIQQVARGKPVTKADLQGSLHLGLEELEQVRYIEYDYRVELSGGTRLAIDGAKNALAGKVVFGVVNACVIMAHATFW